MKCFIILGAAGYPVAPFKLYKNQVSEELNSMVCWDESFVRIDKTNHLFVGTQDLCVQSNKTGSNKTIPIRVDKLDVTLYWTGCKDLASLQNS
jgi:hypothetical protein